MMGENFINQFWAPDNASKVRCEISQRERQRDTFSGIDTITGELRAFEGVVQSVRDFGPDAPDGAAGRSRWPRVRRSLAKGRSRTWDQKARPIAGFDGKATPPSPVRYLSLGHVAQRFRIVSR